MAKPCSVCVSPKAPDLNEALHNGSSHRKVGREFGFSPSTIGRHAAHVPKREASIQSGKHAAAAEAVIAAVRLLTEGDPDDLDEAEIQQFRSLAAALDERPADVALLREFRITQAEIRKRAAPAETDEEQMAYLRIMAELSPHPNAGDGTYQRVFKAARDAGADEDAAMAAATAATSWPHDYPV